MTALGKAPGHWQQTTIGEIAEVAGGIQKQPSRRPRNNTAPFLRVANVQRGRLDLAEVHRIELFEGELARFRLRPGDLLVVEGNGSIQHIGRAALWTGEVADCVHQNHLIRIRPGPDVLPQFLNHYWNSPAAVELIRDAAKTTSGLYTLSSGKVRSVPVAVPPIDEQCAIVATIERMLSVVARTDDTLAVSQRRATAARRAVANRVARNHTSTRLADLLREGLRNGKSVKDGDGVAVLRLGALRGRIIDLSESKKGAWGRVDPSPYLVQRGDFLVSRGNGTLSLVGRGGMVTADPPAVAFPDTMIRVRPDLSRLHLDYLRLAWDSDAVRHQIESAARTTAGIYKINQAMLEELELPLPDPDEQLAAAAWGNRVLSHVSRLGDTVALSRSRSVALRRSILKAAFAGRLSRQGHPAPTVEEHEKALA